MNELNPDKKRVAVIILNWNGEKLLPQFLPSVIQRTHNRLGRVIVADNASGDHSIELLERDFPEVERLHLEQNFGFAGGYNRAIAEVEAEIVVLLNSDVEVEEGWLEPLVAYLDAHPETAAVQPKIKAFRERNKFEYAGACGGYMDRLGFPFCRGRILDAVEEDRGQYDDVAEVFWCSGAALCIRREAYLEAGGLDERFFAHMEEIDLCWRLQNTGKKLAVVPDSVVYHWGGGSLPMNHPRKLFLNYRNNLLMLYKNLPVPQRRRVLFWRSFLDVAAGCLFLAKGQWANAKAIPAAYRSYRKLRKNYMPPQKQNMNACIFPGSIIGKYYFGKVRTFSALKR